MFLSSAFIYRSYSKNSDMDGCAGCHVCLCGLYLTQRCLTKKGVSRSWTLALCLLPKLSAMCSEGIHSICMKAHNGPAVTLSTIWLISFLEFSIIFYIGLLSYLFVCLFKHPASKLKNRSLVHFTHYYCRTVTEVMVFDRKISADTVKLLWWNIWHKDGYTEQEAQKPIAGERSQFPWLQCPHESANLPIILFEQK